MFGQGRLGKESGISSITLRTLVQQLKLKVRQIYHGQAFPSSPSTRAQHAGPCLLTRGIVRAAANARPVRAQVVYVPPESPACYHGQIRRAAASDGEQVANIAGNGREGPELGKKERGKGEGELCLGTDEEMRRGTREDSGRGNGGNAS